MKNFKFQISNFKLQEGFTLAELLVAMSIFVIIITVASGIFIRSMQDENRLTALMGTQSSLNSALEQMAREIRGGYLFNDLTMGSPNCGTTGSYYGPSSLNGYSFMTFVGPNGTTTYSLSGGRIERNGDFLTSQDVSVQNLCFVINQIGSPYPALRPADSCNPWRVSIFLNAEPVASNSIVQPFYLQTTVSSRVLPKDMPAGTKASYDIQNGDRVYESCK
jgi:prepilin-type N-terminal cleavage/methylation domain-containing protein